MELQHISGSSVFVGKILNARKGLSNLLIRGIKRRPLRFIKRNQLRQKSGRRSMNYAHPVSPLNGTRSLRMGDENE